MGCNCNKRKPTGFARPAPPSTPIPASGMPGASADAQTDARKMSFDLRRGSRTVATFGSELEARAAAVRRGGTVHPR